MNKKIESLIEDYKQTIERLQKECTEKTDMNIELMKHVKELEEENKILKNRIEISHKEVNTNIVNRQEDYPKGFYQVLEYLDLVMRNWVGEEMGTKGTWELNMLCGIFAIDWELECKMPTSARAWFIELVNPKGAWAYHHKNGNITGGQLKAYADLRQYLIDNAERVTKAYNLLTAARDTIKNENKDSDLL